KILAALVAVMGLLRLAAYVSLVPVQIDRLLFSNSLFEPLTNLPNRMAPNSGFSFACLGVAMLLLNVRTKDLTRASQCTALVSLAASIIALFGYGFQTAAFYRVAVSIPMALHSAFAFLVLSLGVLFAHPDRGILEPVTRNATGASMARRLLPAAILLQFPLAWICLLGEKAGWYDTAFALAVTALANVFILAGLIWWNTVLLNRAERQQEHFFNVSLELLCIAGFDGYFKRLNPLWEKTLGFTIQELGARPYLDFVHPEDRQATIAETETVRGGAKVLSFENRYQCKDGSWRWFQWNAAPVPELKLIYAAARDVTDRKQMDQQIERLNHDLQRRADELQHVNKELESFSYSVSHDLRAPVRHIRGFLELLQKESAATLDNKGKRYLGLISDSAAQMTRLIDDLLDFSRTGKAQMRCSRVGLQNIVDTTIGELASDANGRQVRWNVRPLPEVRADPSLMRQVMRNLLSNALKYTRPKPSSEIEIGTMPSEKSEHVIYVRDNGVGFDMRFAAKLVGGFQRLHDAEEFEGTGIGLANVQRIINRHGGRTWAEGVVDRGATFYFSLPK
ncbi:MAG: hypothetical protein DME26_16785, partial [Verrucomicrobia bacterium]